MQIPFLHQQIILETEKLRDTHRSMMMHESTIPTAEMESFLQQLRKIYGIALQLGNENALQQLNEIHLANAQQFAAKELENEAAKVREAQNLASIKTDIPPENKQPEENRVAAPPAKNIAAKENTTPSGQTVAKKFTEHATLGNKIAGTDSHKRLSDNLKLPVKDIHAAIGINEKFQFISQLFHGDSNKYNQFIQEMNNCPSVELAHDTIKQIADTNRWENQPTAKHLIELIERKFTA
jgi:hypothetical protein